MAFAVVTEHGGFDDAGQQRLDGFVGEVGFLGNGQIRRGLEAGFGYPGFFLNAVLGNFHTVAAGAHAGFQSQGAHGLGIDVFKFGGNGGASGQVGQGAEVVIRGADVFVGQGGGGGVGVGIEHGYAVAHLFGGHGKHPAQLASAQNAQHGGR